MQSVISHDVQVFDAPPRQDISKQYHSPLDKYRTLELNADFRPLSYYPLSTMGWQQVMFLYIKGLNTNQPRFTVVEYYDDVFVSTSKAKIKLPSVIAHLEYLKPPKRVPLTKFNSFLRDDFTCQYSGEKCSPRDLSWDHVIPQVKGGKSTWENIVTARRDINSLKGDLSLKEFKKYHGYELRHMPITPTFSALQELGKKYPPNYLHESWDDYLYWSTEIDP